MVHSANTKPPPENASGASQSRGRNWRWRCSITASSAAIALAPAAAGLQRLADVPIYATDPLVRQFVNAEAEGPVHFHYPGPSVADDFGRRVA